MQNDKIKEYWEGEAGIYSEGIKAELKSETAENWKNLILEYAPEKEHLEVLDVGCGPGFFACELARRVSGAFCACGAEVGADGAVLGAALVTAARPATVGTVGDGAAGGTGAVG